MARPRIQTPKQRRSVDTLERVLAAAEEQIGLAGLAGLDLRRVCERAGVTTGAFYGRFRKKEDLLTELLQRFVDETAVKFGDFLEATRDLRSEQAVVAALIDAVTSVYDERGALIAALIEGSYQRRELRSRAAHFIEGAAKAFALALARAHGMKREPSAVRFATFLVFAWLDQALYLGEIARRDPRDRARLEAAVIASWTGARK